VPATLQGPVSRKVLNNLFQGMSHNDTSTHNTNINRNRSDNDSIFLMAAAILVLCALFVLELLFVTKFIPRLEKDTTAKSLVQNRKKHIQIPGVLTYQVKESLLRPHSLPQPRSKTWLPQ